MRDQSGARLAFSMIDLLREIGPPIIIGLLAGAAATVVLVLGYLGIKVWEQR